nr:hypothetical protein [Tanacetum cinerariifolium]
MSYASSAATYTSVYTDSEPWRFYRGSDEEPAEAGPEHPPSPDYVPGPEYPPSPVYVPEPEYLKYLVPSGDEAPVEDQPLPADASFGVNVVEDFKKYTLRDYYCWLLIRDRKSVAKEASSGYFDWAFDVMLFMYVMGKGHVVCINVVRRRQEQVYVVRVTKKILMLLRIVINTAYGELVLCKEWYCMSTARLSCLVMLTFKEEISTVHVGFECIAVTTLGFL